MAETREGWAVLNRQQDHDEAMLWCSENPIPQQVIDDAMLDLSAHGLNSREPGMLMALLRKIIGLALYRQHAALPDARLIAERMYAADRSEAIATSTDTVGTKLYWGRDLNDASFERQRVYESWATRALRAVTLSAGRRSGEEAP